MQSPVRPLENANEVGHRSPRRRSDVFQRHERLILNFDILVRERGDERRHGRSCQRAELPERIGGPRASVRILGLQLADQGRDVSRFFKGQGRMVQPIQRVNVDLTAGMLEELDKAAQELNVSRQAVIKTLVRQGLDQQYLARRVRRP